ncbi:hypothetical protein [Halobacteriovorax sp. DPLXC-1]|uniref:hypothetical protein n=1 Tax=Halobacteriovorax sp. DPLXC-1 TaxID=3110771 RepID=UPI002FEEBE4A
MLNMKFATPLFLLILFTAFIGSFMQYDDADEVATSRGPASTTLGQEGPLMYECDI